VGMSRFGQFPEVFEHVAPEFRPFTYDFEQRTFTIAGETLELANLDLYKNLLLPVGAPISANELLEVPVALDIFGHPVTTPELFSWLTKPETSEHFQQTADVMRDAFSELGDILKERHHKEMNAMGFSCYLLREGHISLSVLGNCACLGTNPDGHLITMIGTQVSPS